MRLEIELSWERTLVTRGYDINGWYEQQDVSKEFATVMEL